MTAKEKIQPQARLLAAYITGLLVTFNVHTSIGLSEGQTLEAVLYTAAIVETVSALFRSRRGGKAAALLLVLLLSPLAACDVPSSKAIDVVRCTAEDDRLSLVLRSPERAAAYLERLGQRLEAGEPEAMRDAADLAARLAACAKKAE